MHSVADSGLQAARFVLLADAEYERTVFQSHKLATISLAQLNLPDERARCFKYTPFELIASVKPLLVDYLLEQGFDLVTYLDDDTYVYRSRETTIDTPNRYCAIFTPPLTELLFNDGMPFPGGRG